MKTKKWWRSTACGRTTNKTQPNTESVYLTRGRRFCYIKNHIWRNQIMGKLYTLDQKLLTNTPEIRIGEKIYPIDDRTKTVMKVTKMDTSDAENISKILELALGKPAAKEVDEMNLPFVAYLKLLEIIIAAMTGEEPETVSARFQEATQKSNQKSN
nr:MAG TPA: hypothetical protein [Caudoviricetes sp.]